MTDINLLQDSKSPGERKKKTRTPDKIEMTQALKEGKKEEKYQKPPSSFFKNIFSRKKKDPDEENEERELPTFKKAQRGEEKIKEEKQIEDIFASVKEPKENTSAITADEKNMTKDAAPSPGPINIELPEKEEEEEKKPEFKKEEKIGKSPEFKKEDKEEEEKKKKKEEKKGKEAKKDRSFLVNLLPEDLVGREDPKKKLINLGLIILGTVLFVAILYFVMIFYQSNIVTKAEELKLERLTVEQQIDIQDKLHRESIAFKEKMDSAKDILNTHIYWTKFFALLENYTVKDVYFESALNLTHQSVITLTASAPDYETVAEQLIVFQNAHDFVQSVSITSASENILGVAEGIPPGSPLSRQVSFSIALELVPDVFYKTDLEVGTGEEYSNLNTNTSLSPNLNLNTNTSLNTNFNLNTNTNYKIIPIDLNSNLNTNSAPASNTNLNFYFNLNTNNSLNTNSE